MKGFIGLVLAAIAVGTVLVGGAIAFGFAASTETVVHSVEDYGLSEYSVSPRDDLLGIQITWTAFNLDTTFVLERSLDGSDESWQHVVTIEPGSSHFTSENTVEYLDEDVEHMLTYTYRVLLSDSSGGSGGYYLDTVTAIDPAR